MARMNRRPSAPRKPRYATGPVDPSKPVELDDGRECTIESRVGPDMDGDYQLNVLVHGSPSRGIGNDGSGPQWWAYCERTGVLLGSSAVESCVLRNKKIDPAMLPKDTLLRRKRRITL